MKATQETLKSLGRLKRRSDFLRVQDAGRKWVSQTMIVQIAENGGKECSYGLTVSRKTDKSAVVRNRIRRRLRTVAASILPLHIKVGHDIVLIGRKPAETRAYADLEKDLLWCLKRLAVLKDDI